MSKSHGKRRNGAKAMAQFSLKRMFWLIAVVATVLTGWAMLDVAHLASESGEVPYLTLLGMASAYVVGSVTLAKMRERL